MDLKNIFKKTKTVENTAISAPAERGVSKPSSAPTELRKGKRDFVEGLVSTKDIIAPSALEVDTDFIKIGEKYYRTVFTIINRRFVEINWLSSLINFDASLAVSMYIYPSDGKEILDDLRRKITEMEAELTTDIQRGKIVNPVTQAKLEDALNLQADLVKGEERFFQMGLYVTINADTKADLDRTTKNLESAMGALMVLTKKTNYQSEDAFITTLPLGIDRLNLTRNMDTTSLATTFPFVSSDLSDDKGIMYGINEHNGSLVIFDRFSMQNYNSVVFATAGAGKSYMIKLEAMRSLMMGTEIIVIDPENEYRDLCDAVGGQYIAFGYGEASKINPFDLSLVVDEGENALNSKILSVHKLLKIMIGEMDPIEESILDRAVMDAYKMKGITPDPESQTKEAPLIEDLYKSLIGMEDPKAQSLAARLEKYIKGSFAGIFNQKTTVNLSNAFVVFGIRNLEDTLRPIAMHVILDYIWTIVKKDLKKRILIVDEAWYLMQFPDSAAFLRGIVKRGRKYYLGVTTITQDVDDFLQTPYGREIVTNSAIQILLKQHSAAIDQIGEVFYLSEGEKQLLLAADKGEGIFFAGQNHVAIRVVASEDEHKLITSNPEEVMKMKQQSKLLQEKQQNTIITPPSVTMASIETDKIEEKPIQYPSPTLPLTLQNGELAEQGVVQKNIEPKAELPTEIKVLDNQERPITAVELPIKPTEAKTEELLKRISDMENEEKRKIEEHQKKVEDDKNVKSVETAPVNQAGGLPKYQDLFINKDNKLPPLPPLPKFVPPTNNNPLINNGLGTQTPKFVPPKVETVSSPTLQKNTPLFINQVQEVKIPQPPQFAKKATIQFEENKPIQPPPKSPLEEMGTLKQNYNQTPSIPLKEDTVPVDKAKMDYDKLFGNGIV